MKKILPLFIFLLSCTTTKYVPVNQIRHITTIERDTIIEIVTQPERVVNTTTDTISQLRTKYAKSEAIVNNGVLYHNLVQLPVKDSARVRIPHTIITDSIPYPVEVEKIKEVAPTWCWFTLITSGLVVIYIIIVVLRKLRI